MVSGLPSRARCLELTKTPWGDVPVQPDTSRRTPWGADGVLAVWQAHTLGPEPRAKSVYTTYEPISKRVRGAPSLQQKMKKGCVTA